MEKHVKQQLEGMKNWMEEKIEGCTLNEEKDVENNVAELIVVKDNVEEVATKHDETILKLDCL